MDDRDTPRGNIELALQCVKNNLESPEDKVAFIFVSVLTFFVLHFGL